MEKLWQIFIASILLAKILMLIPLVKVSALDQDDDETHDFIFNGFYRENLTTDGAANITANGLLRLTTEIKSQSGHAFFPKPLSFKNSTTGGNSSFSTTFVFAIVSKDRDSSGTGFAFVMSPSKADLQAAQSGPYLGLFNSSNNGDPSNHIAAIEFDTVFNKEIGDIDDNHVGIDFNSLKSFNASPAGYYDSNSENGETFTNISLASGRRFQAWVEYDGVKKQLNVTLAPVQISKPTRPLLSSTIDISLVITEDPVYLGFSASTASHRMSLHYVLGWSFKMNGEAQFLDISILPEIPVPKKKSDKGMIIGVSSAAAVLLLLILVCGIVYYKLKRRGKFVEAVMEEWERQIGAHRIPYKDLHKATDGFQEANVIGVGGFGKVYQGILPASKMEVAVKKVSHDSEEGMRQFLAEITSLGRLRSPNFVELLGYSRRKGELLLVYEFMRNGSLDNLLYHHNEEPSNITPIINHWGQRFRIIKQVASGLFYLHERWAQAILHRDIKPANVLLDENLNGKLGDFGLSRLYEHGSDPNTTRLAGTVGYMAPELSRTGRATKASDVYAFGVLMLEVVCGRRPIKYRAPHEREVMLIDWVLHCFKEGTLFSVVDSRLSFRKEDVDEVQEEVEMVLKLGLLCTHDSAGDRPAMREVVRFLDRELPLPEVPADHGNLQSTDHIAPETWSTSEGSENLLTSSTASIGYVSFLSKGR